MPPPINQTNSHRNSSASDSRISDAPATTRISASTAKPVNVAAKPYIPKKPAVTASDRDMNASRSSSRMPISPSGIAIII